MFVVDMYRWYRSKKYEEKKARGQSISNELLAFWKFSYRLCVNLERKLMMGRASAQSLWHMVTNGQNEHEALERIQRNGLATQNSTDKQIRMERRSVG